MLRSPLSTDGRRCARLGTSISTAILAAILLAGGASADPPEIASLDSLGFARGPIGPLLGALPRARGQADGLAFVDLPLGFRARFDAVYSHHLYSSDVLSQSFVADFGPGIEGDRKLESRVSLTRPLRPDIELEIAWETRNSLAVSDPMGFGRQTIGARIRISP